MRSLRFSLGIRKYLQLACGITDINDVDLLYFRRHHMDNGDRPKPANEVLRKMYADAPLGLLPIQRKASPYISPATLFTVGPHSALFSIMLDGAARPIVAHVLFV